jgi:hypothetical protein
VSYPPRIFFPPGPVTRADVEKCSPPPTWTDADQRAYERAWSRGHVSSPDTKERARAEAERVRREAAALPTADHWREVFGIEIDATPPKLNADQAAAYYACMGRGQKALATQEAAE